MIRLKKDFYTRPATELSVSLLGKLLVRKTDQGIIKARITETECYFGEEDTACHAHRGKTERTRILYEEGGLCYVYLCYGIHSLLNVVTGDRGHPEAVLIRAVEGYNGPGKLTKALGITRTQNYADLCTSDELWIEDDGFVPERIMRSKRVGIDYATQEYRDMLWNFRIEQCRK